MLFVVEIHGSLTLPATCEPEVSLFISTAAELAQSAQPQ